MILPKAVGLAAFPFFNEISEIFAADLQKKYICDIIYKYA